MPLLHHRRHSLAEVVLRTLVRLAILLGEHLDHKVDIPVVLEVGILAHLVEDMPLLEDLDTDPDKVQAHHKHHIPQKEGVLTDCMRSFGHMEVEQT